MANYGLMDQIAALKWVQENIRNFGGNPDSITLFGHNRGAALIHYLMQSPVVVPGKNASACITFSRSLIYFANLAANLSTNPHKSANCARSLPFVLGGQH